MGIQIEYPIAELSKRATSYVMKYAQFRAVAAIEFGTFNKAIGKIYEVVPNMSGTWAIQMMQYWLGEAKRIESYYRTNANGTSVSGADFQTWRQHVANLQVWFDRAQATFQKYGKQWAPPPDVYLTWEYVARVMMGMNAYSVTPGASFIDAYASELARYAGKAGAALLGVVKGTANAIARAGSAFLGGLIPPWLWVAALGGAGLWVYFKFYKKD